MSRCRHAYEALSERRQALCQAFLMHVFHLYVALPSVLRGHPSNRSTSTWAEFYSHRPDHGGFAELLRACRRLAAKARLWRGCVAVNKLEARV